MIKNGTLQIGLRVATCLFTLLCGYAFAQTYPVRPVKVVIALSAGGTADTTVRLLAQRLSEALKQPVIVENKPGGGGVIGADFVAKSAPDGHTLFLAEAESMFPGTLMRSSTPYDPLKDFVHIALLYTFPSYLTVRSDHPAKTFQEFIAMARARPGAINYASAGIGSSGFLSGELLKQAAAISMAHVPYKGIAPAVNALMGGHVDAVFASYAASAEQVRSGKLRVLATTGEARVKALPDVPTIGEIVPGVSGYGWHGISAPAKTPQAVVRRLESEIMKTVTSVDMKATLTGLWGGEPLPLASDEFAAFIENEMRKWGPVVKAGNIRVDK